MNARFGRNSDPDAVILRSPTASHADLHRIGAERPDLHARLAAHPNAYPDLLNWLAESPRRDVQAALAKRSARDHTTRSARTKWILGIGGGLVLVLVAAVAIFAFTDFSGPRFDRAPSQIAAVDLDDLGADTRLTTLPGRSDTSADEQILQLVGQRRSVIVAVNVTTMTPKWMVPLPHSHLSASEPEDTGSESSALEGTPQECTWDGDSLTCGNQTIGLDDGEVSIAGDSDDEASAEKDTNAEEGARSDTGARTNEESAALIDPRTEAAGVKLGDDGALLAPDGTEIPDLNFGADAAIRVLSNNEYGPWIVSDGVTVVGIDGDSVLWKTRLGEGAAQASGLGEPRMLPNWALVDGVLVLADDQGVHGLKADTGAELWRVDAALGSFTISGHSLSVVDQDGVLEIFDFTDSSSDSTVTANPNFAPEGPAPALAELPGDDAFTDATLSIPPACAEFGLAYDDYFLGDSPKSPQDEHKATFSGGKASAAHGSGHGSVEMSRFAGSRMGAQALTLVEFTCFGGGTYSYPSLGVYDADLNLLDSVELWDFAAERGDSADISGYLPKPYFTSIGQTGNYISASIGGVGVVGDEACAGCEKSATADVLYRLDGGSLRHEDTVFHVADGDVRAPDTAAVQKFADAVADGRDDEAKSSATAEVMVSLEDELGDGSAANPETVRSVQFPVGVTVDTCELIQPFETGAYGGYYFLNERTASSLSAQEPIKAGDFVCGVDLPGISAGDEYPAYLLLRGTADGHVMVYEAGRQFG